MKRVIVESPYSSSNGHSIETNLDYLRAAMRDCLLRSEAPFASHGLYPQPGVLRDDVPNERALGIAAGFAWHESAEMTVVYTDLGITDGMKQGIANANEQHRPVEMRSLPSSWPCDD